MGKQDSYCVSQSNAEGPAMRAVREKMVATPWGAEWEKRLTMFSYGEEMSTDPLEAMLLKELTYLSKARRVLEIGMFVGYGSVAMLESLSAVQVVSLEIDPYLKDWLASCLADFPAISSRHEVVVGPALESIPKLTGKFDLVFVDANKAEYKGYIEAILEYNLLSPLGMIVCDNVLYKGYPYVHLHFDAQPARRGFGDHLKVFNQWVADHPKLEQVVLPVRDGISLIRMRTDAETINELRCHSGRIIELCHSSGSSCKVSTYAAHLLSWCPFPGNEHGFVRTSSKWMVLRQSNDSVSLVLKADVETLKDWAKDFEFIYTISLSADSVRMEMEVINSNSTPLEFTGCLHSYWRCGSSENCAVEGLKGGKFDTGIGSCFRGDSVEDRSAGD